MSAYAASTASTWQTCAVPDDGAAGRINCLMLGGYIHNARLDYLVTNIGTAGAVKVTPNPINTRNGFGGGFIGDYTDLAVGSDDAYHAFWTDTNNQQERRLVLRVPVPADVHQSGRRRHRVGHDSLTA